MRILYIADETTQSGAMKSFEEMVSTVNNDDAIECVVITNGMTDIGERLEKQGIVNISTSYASFMQNRPITWWKILPKYVISGFKYYRYRFSSIKDIEQQLDLKLFDLIHCNINRVDVGTELAKKYEIPNVMHIREFGTEDFKCWSYRKNYVRYLNDNVTRFIVISEAVKTSWVERGLLPEKIDVIYNGVDSQHIETIKDSHSYRQEKLQLVIVGGVIPAKGQVDAIHALSCLPADVLKNVSLDIIGWSSKSYFSKIQDEIERLGLRNKVHVLGARGDVYKILKNYQIGLMCSKAEGFGRVTVEYMCAGLGVIASNCGANPEIVEEGKTGLMYRQGDPKALSDCILKYYYDRELLIRCAIQGMAKAKNNYTKEVNAGHIKNLYHRMLDV